MVPAQIAMEQNDYQDTSTQKVPSHADAKARRTERAPHTRTPPRAHTTTRRLATRPASPHALQHQREGRLLPDGPRPEQRLAPRSHYDYSVRAEGGNWTCVEGATTNAASMYLEMTRGVRAFFAPSQRRVTATTRAWRGDVLPRQVEVASLVLD